VDTTALQAGVTNGAVNLITDVSRYPVNVNAYAQNSSFTYQGSIDDLQLKAIGPLMTLWAGAPSLAIGAEHQINGTTAESHLPCIPPPTLQHNRVLHIFPERKSRATAPMQS